MAKIVWSTPPKTIKALTELYRMAYQFDKQAGKEQQFLQTHGTEEQWVSQFKRTVSIDRDE